ncbi:MAG TPA: hypothetical protein VD970_02475, partial [Acetobacteraceae bacterium]|nr:hypothetical protein [Acetobacteraceae bacterium]
AAGVGHAEGGPASRVAGGLFGATGGALAGSALQGVLRPGGVFGGMAQPVERAAVGKVAQAVARSGKTPEQLLEEGKGRPPEARTMVADLDRSLLKTARAAESVPSKGSEQIAEAFAQRVADEGDVAATTLQRTTGTTPRNVFEMVDALDARRSAAAEQMYGPIRGRVVEDERIYQVLAHPDIRRAYERAVKIRQNENAARALKGEEPLPELPPIDELTGERAAREQAALVEKYGRDIRNATMAGAEAAGKEAKRLRTFETAAGFGTVSTGAGAGARGRLTQATRRSAKVESELQARGVKVNPDRAFLEAVDKDPDILPFALSEEHAALRSLPDDEIMLRLSDAEEAAYYGQDDLVAQSRRALYSGEAHRRGLRTGGGLDAGERVTAATVRFRGKVYSGAEHGEAARRAAADFEDVPKGDEFWDFYLDNPEFELGFATTRSPFVTREQATEIARAAKQVPEHVTEVHGEDLLGRYAQAEPAPAGPRLTLDTLDQVKRALDDMLYLGRRSPLDAGGLGPAEDASLRGLKNALLEALDDAVPEYKQARGVYAGRTELMQALDEGRGALSLPTDALEHRLAQLSEGEREAFRMGLLAAEVESLGNARTGRDVVGRLAGSPNALKRLRATYPKGPEGDQQFAEAKRVFDALVENRRSAQFVLGGSPTARIAREQDDLEAPGAAVLQAAAGGPRNALQALGTQLVRRGLQGYTEKKVDAMAPLLTSTDLEGTLARIGRYLQEEEARRRAPVRLPARAAAAVTGALLGRQF